MESKTERGDHSSRRSSSGPVGPPFDLRTRTQPALSPRNDNVPTERTATTGVTESETSRPSRGTDVSDGGDQEKPSGVGVWTSGTRDGNEK